MGYEPPTSQATLVIVILAFVAICVLVALMGFAMTLGRGGI
jgi:hypothetical protein